MTIYIDLDYFASGVERDHCYISIDELNLPQSLVDEFSHWKEMFDRTFDASFPPASGFPDEESFASFQALGRILAKKFDEALDTHDVVYVPLQHHVRTKQD